MAGGGAEDASLTEDDASQEQPAQNAGTEDTSQTGDDASQEQPAQDEAAEDASLTGDGTAEVSPTDEENEGAEDAAASEETVGAEESAEETEAVEEAEIIEEMEELSADAASGDGFTITDGVLTAYTGTDTDIEIPGNVTAIGKNAFKDNKTIQTVTFPSSVVTIESRAFLGCSNLKSVTLNNGLKTIDERAFGDCVSLERLELPSTVTEIGNSAFHKCTALKSVKLNEGLKTIGNLAFADAGLGNMAAGENLIIPGTVESIGDGAFSSCKYLETVTFENGENEVLDLKSGASNYRTFFSCENLTKVELPDRLKTINWGTFHNCTKLKEVSFGSRLDTIGALAFAGCVSLERIELPSTVTTIEKEAFESCTGLKTVELNEGLKTIGNGAFSGAGLGNMAAGEDLIIPGTVESIGDGAFSSCKYLETVKFENGENDVLDLKSGDRNFAAFGRCENLTTVILPERITKLDLRAFFVDPKLEILYIPEKVKEIHDNAIVDCPKLTIYGVPGSMAETYANEKNIPFKNKSELGAVGKVQSVSVTPDKIEETGEAAIGKQIQLTAVVMPGNALNKKVTYSSNNEQVASVDEKGLVTIKGYGEAKITVTTEDGGKTAECTVYITEGSSSEEPPAEEPPQDPIEKPTDSKKPEIKGDLVFFPKNAPTYRAIYTGEQIRPAMAVYYECEYQDATGNTKTQRLKLKLNVDYTVRYAGNINAGDNTAKVTVRGIGEYAGTVSKNFTIKAKNISGVVLSPVGDILYGQEPKVVVTDGNRELKEGTDYTVDYTPKGSANTNMQAKLTVKGIGNYTGVSKKSMTFNILKTSTGSEAETELLPINENTVSIGWKNPAKVYTYNGKAQKPAVVVTDNNTGKKLSTSRYKVIYTNNINAGDEARAYVVGVSKNGKGYYGMADPLTFSIKKKAFNKVSATAATVPKAGTIGDIQDAVRESLVVKDGKRILEAETDYTINFGTIKSAEAIKTGQRYEITLTPAANGNYDQSTSKTIKIKFGQLSLASKAATVTVTITNASQNEIVLTYNGDTLKKDTDYTAKVSKDKKGDTYTVKIKAVKGGSYKGSRTVKKLKLK